MRQADGVRLAVDRDGDRNSLRVKLPVDIEQLQDQFIPLALDDIVASKLLEFHETAGRSLVCSPIEDPVRLREGFSNLLLDMHIVVKPGALDECFVFAWFAGRENVSQE